jgi:hypothetical protein
LITPLARLGMALTFRRTSFRRTFRKHAEEDPRPRRRLATTPQFVYLIQQSDGFV